MKITADKRYITNKLLTVELMEIIQIEKNCPIKLIFYVTMIIPMSILIDLLTMPVRIIFFVYNIELKED